MNTLERTEVIILDDSEQVRAEIAAAVRKILPELNVNESGDAEEVMKAIDESAAKILVLISDSQIRDSVRIRLEERTEGARQPKETVSAPLSRPDGMDVTQAAKRAGIPHVVYYSINSAWAGGIMCGDGIVCITKPLNKHGIDTHKHPALENWLQCIRATIFSEIQPR